MRKVKLFTFLVFFITQFPVFAGIKEEVAKTIVRVRSGNKYSTGFFWKNGSTILTTLHSLSNSNQVEVYIPAIKDWKTAKIKQVYKSGDLISLQVLNYSSLNYLTNCYTTKPSLDTKVFTIGYNSGNTTYMDRDFSVGLFEGNTLGDFLPAAARNEIQKLSFPSLGVQIVYLKGQPAAWLFRSAYCRYAGKTDRHSGWRPGKRCCRYQLVYPFCLYFPAGSFY